MRAIQLNALDTLRAKMKDAPEVAREKRTVSKQEAVRELRKDIEEMQKRGYTLEDISTFLTSEGLQITTPTLKSYLNRARSGIKRHKVSSHAVSTKKDATSAKKVAATSQTKVSSSKDTKEDNKGSFSVRPDSDI